MKTIFKRLTTTTMCGFTLACLTVNAAEDGMLREPRPGERIEATKMPDEQIRQLLVGKWIHEHELPKIATSKQTYTFGEDGSYTMHAAKRDVFEDKKRELNEKGEWKVQEGILILTPTDPKGIQPRQSGRFTAYTIMSISKTAIEWQVNWEKSDAPPWVRRSVLITTHKRAK
jgi:hypothetical protein